LGCNGPIYSKWKCLDIFSKEGMGGQSSSIFQYQDNFENIMFKKQMGMETPS
jgi:hypothetical protein